MKFFVDSRRAEFTCLAFRFKNSYKGLDSVQYVAPFSERPNTVMCFVYSSQDKNVLR